MAIKLPLTIQEIWELINTLFLTNPPSQEIIQFIEETSNASNGPHENLYEYFVQETDIYQVMYEWAQLCDFKEVFLAQYTEHTIHQYYDEFELTYSYDESDSSTKMCWFILSYIKNNQSLIRLR